MTRLLSIVLLLASLGVVTASASSQGADWGTSLDAIGQECSSDSGPDDTLALQAPRPQLARAWAHLRPPAAWVPAPLSRAFTHQHIRAPPVFTA
ncbi:hypothetical protein [Parahaliea mediterranea]|uniref:hypothetical protein n=1 Tax=Parahaliea mediterranea TaxID=651086 RepID=UPI000E2E9AF6|nr:hypothetical protein [Parahaliea mediterranea]